MAWRYHGRARISASNPQATAVCDDCKFLYNRVDLRPQMEWRGDKLMPTGFVKCRRCIDIPFEFNRPLRLPPDPMPIDDPRAENYRVEMTDFRTVGNGNRRVTMDGQPRVIQQTGDIMLETLHG